MLKSSLCDYSDAYIFVKGTISIAPVLPTEVNPNNNDKEVVFKNCAPSIDWISEINNTQIDNSIYIDIIMPMYNLTKYSNNYSRATGSLWKYYRDEPFLDDNDVIADVYIATVLPLH